MMDGRWARLRLALTVAGFAYLFAAWLQIVPFTLNLGVPPGIDTFAYWTADPADPYGLSELGTTGAYLYSPVFAQAFSPFRLLPLELVYGIWVAASVAALAWMRVMWTVALPPVLMELYAGNIHIFYAAAIVAGVRWSATWALPVLTKVTPGIGMLWFAFRREWQSFFVAVGVNAALIAASVAIDASIWLDWIDTLRVNQDRSLNMVSDQVPILLRTAAAAGLLAWGAIHDRRWVLPVGVLLAMPVIWPGAAAVLIAMASPRLWADKAEVEKSSTPSASRSTGL